jgi:hypothetical protein
MKQLDKETVLEIIKMLNISFNDLNDHLHNDLEKDNLERDECRIEYIKGGMHQLNSVKKNLQSLIELDELKQHLQSFIERKKTKTGE